MTERVFPFEEVRDLVGLMRAVYGARKARGADRGALAAVKIPTERLIQAATYARASGGDPCALRIAFKELDEALPAVMRVLDASDLAAEIVEAARRRVRNRGRGRAA